jgi:hypothetical protein
MKRPPAKYNITPPKELYRIKVNKDWRYGKHARFWEIEKFNQEASNRYGEVAYFSCCRGGLAYSEWGLRFAVRRRLKKMKIGYSTNYYSLGWERLNVSD